MWMKKIKNFTHIDFVVLVEESMDASKQKEINNNHNMSDD